MENPAEENDTRFTAGLLYDVFNVLKEHGYEEAPKATVKDAGLCDL